MRAHVIKRDVPRATSKSTIRLPYSTAVVGDPTARVSEQPHAPDVLAIGQQEPMVPSLGHYDQIALLYLHSHPPVVRAADVEDAFSLQHEPHFIFIVVMLIDELRADRTQVRSGRRQ